MQILINFGFYLNVYRDRFEFTETNCYVYVLCESLTYIWMRRVPFRMV